MSRGSGFAIADIDVRVLFDTKFRRLAKALAMDEGEIGATFLVWFSTLVSSWGDGRRMTAVEAESFLAEATPARISVLRDVGLLDGDGRIPEHAWASWYGAALGRKEARRFEGTVGGLMKSLGLSKDDAIAEARRRFASGGPEVALGEPNPTVPSSPTSPTVPTADLVTSNNGRTTDRTTCPGCGDGPLDDREDNVVVANRAGQLRHRTCPALLVVA